MRLDHLLSKEMSKVLVYTIKFSRASKDERKLHISGGDAFRGHTRTHPEHDG